ncbi:MULTISPECIES: MFS transporter [Desulfococcus]|uniref:Phospholipid/glycerol acyltransferase n=1 Tax=Desulfococcus multivorans DSM 2059 TaxID=1121405 RepID=S7V1P4_DESML|nr:MFS transporter [Desulfococcus multivorans]AQV02869.2 MFS transporter [Desulfococcus multivorans]EPR40424.1 phospholipid/glycerol acyltransferase [Desulfococcus multivorans DSM 2059]SJZ76186.1 1-acyl-sn-glycerol-3-phosphate acyltransferases [Desulfococcus multivorans DSM 2059]
MCLQDLNPDEAIPMTSTPKNKEPIPQSQFGLLRIRRFAPFFWTQFFGAFNDNVFKNALIILIAYQGSRMLEIDTNILINLSAGLFILPFFLFSATAGQFSDKYEKAMMIRRIKLMEIVIMGFAAAAFYFENMIALMLLLFFMGAQSAFFGPVKYSIIPQHLAPEELVGGNAMVGMGTFVSILLGTITGGVLVQLENGTIWIGLTVCVVAIAGWGVSRLIPRAEALSPSITIRINPLTQTWKTIGYARRTHSVFLSILGISWFWFLGSAYLTQIPNFTRFVLRSDESVVTLLLTMFSIGIGAGSLLCEKLSGQKVELGLVPLGSLGLSLFGIDLFLAYDPPEVSQLMDITRFISTPGSPRVLCDLVLIGISGGLYIVPLNAFVQLRTEPGYRARVIAANNILNAFFMVLSTGIGILFLGILKLSIPHFFLIVALGNILVAAYIYSVVPEFTMRFLIWILTHTLYRVRHEGLSRVPDEGAALLVCNHVSYVDGLLIAGTLRRPVRFVVFEPIYRLPVLHFVFRTGKAIPITSENIDPQTFHQAFETIDQALADGELVCIFPEGKLTTDGNIQQFRPGVETILNRRPVPVIPMALRGLWGSFFSHKGGPAMTRRPRRLRSKVEIVCAPPMPPEQATAEALREAVAALRGNHP